MTSLGARREAVRAEKGLGGPSLVELHEEWAWQSGQAARLAGWVIAGERHRRAAERLDSEVRARIAAQPIGAWEGENPGLRYGIPDAERRNRRAHV